MKTPIHPGEVLKDEIEACGINAATVAKEIKVPGNRLSQIMQGKRGTTAETALKLGKFFGNSAHFWMKLQYMYELDSITEEHRKEIESIIPLNK